MSLLVSVVLKTSTSALRSAASPRAAYSALKVSQSTAHSVYRFHSLSPFRMQHNGVSAKGDEPNRPKKLILLCDGTWQNSDVGWEKDGFFDKGHPQVPTNVTRMARAISPLGDDKKEQVVYYQAGVGSGWSLTDEYLGGILASGLSENVREAYGFLAHNYLLADQKKGIPESDEIYLMGFSRGAFTARSVGGMLSSVGLLTKEAMQYFYPIFEDYQGAGEKNYKAKMGLHPWFHPDWKFETPSEHPGTYLEAYKAELVRLGLTQEVKIQAIGVWDTVGTLGLPIVPWLQAFHLPATIHKYRFYDTGISNLVLNAFQALALDEKRAAFQAAVWEKKPGNTTTNLKQVWFPGVHSNIGGGYDDTSISDMTIAWMMDQLSPMIDFNESYLTTAVDTNIANLYTPKPNSPSTAQVPQWSYAQGTLYETLVWPIILAGWTTRKPGTYHVTNYLTGKPEPKKMLQNTHEYVHSSVRARMQFHGTDAKGHEPYKSHALANWELVAPDFADEADTASMTKTTAADGSLQSGAYWKYTGDEEEAQGRQLQEAGIGEHEMRMLNLNPEFKKKLFG